MKSKTDKIIVVGFIFLSTFLCEEDKRNDLTAQKIGMLELELKELKKKVGGVSN